MASGEVTIVEALTMTAFTSLNVMSDGRLECTALMCVLQLRAHDTNVHGPLTGGDINITSIGSMSISGTISADAMGYGAEAGDGSGESSNSWTASNGYTTYYDEQSSAGSGGGHGGNGGDSCWQGSYTRAPILI